MSHKFNINQITRMAKSYTISSTTGCWEWNKSLSKQGYGTFTANNKRYRAHRATYMALVGDIPEGLVLDHLCRNTRCVNPEHLEPVTQRENVLRGVGPAAQNAGKSHCPRNHALVDANLIPALARKGGRACRACDVAARKARHQGLKGQAREKLIVEKSNSLYNAFIRRGAALDLEVAA
jgi:hypothetical protein